MERRSNAFEEIFFPLNASLPLDICSSIVSSLAMNILAAAAAEALISSPSRSTKHFSRDEFSLGLPPSAHGLPSVASRRHRSRVFNNSLSFIFIPGGKNKNPRAIASSTVGGGIKGSSPPVLEPSTPMPVYIELPVATFTGIPAEVFNEKRKYSHLPPPSPAPTPALPNSSSATNIIPKRAPCTIPKSSLTPAPNNQRCECGATYSAYWRPGRCGRRLCNACGVKTNRAEGRKRNFQDASFLSLTEKTYDPTAAHVSSGLGDFSKRKKSRKSSVSPLNVIAAPVVEEGADAEGIAAARRSSRTSKGVQDYIKMNGGK